MAASRNIRPDGSSELSHTLWTLLRASEAPVTVRELARRAGRPGVRQAMSVSRLVTRWSRGGLVSLIDSPRQIMLNHTAAAPPRGAALDNAPSARQRIWVAMRALKRFDIPSLMMASEAGRGTITAFVNELVRADYLRLAVNGGGGRWGTYQLVRRSGRLAPKVRRTDGPAGMVRILFDPNDGRSTDISPARRSPPARAGGGVG